MRCVRNFLKINIVSQEEIGAKQVEEIGADNPISPSAVLFNIMKEKNISFDSIKKKLISEKFDKAEDMSSINDIPKPKVFELIERLKKAK